MPLIRAYFNFLCNNRLKTSALMKFALEFNLMFSKIIWSYMIIQISHNKNQIN